jgi:hypothetical protein
MRLGNTDGKLAVMRVGEAYAGGLDEKPNLLGLGGVNQGRCFNLLTHQASGFICRDDRLVRRSVRKPHAALVAGPDLADCLQGNGLDEVTR